MSLADHAPVAVTLTDEVLAVAAAPDQVEDEVVSRLEARRVLRLVRQRLDPLERRVLIWRFGLAGSPHLSVREISERTGLALGTVFNVEHRALAKLRGLYDEEPAA